VDDHLFIWILKEHLPSYNQKRYLWHQDITARGTHYDGGRIWFGGQVFSDGTLEEFDEDCTFPIMDLSDSSSRSLEDSHFSYDFLDIDRISRELGIPWEILKDIPFSTRAPYIGFEWDLFQKLIYLKLEKKEKYLHAIRTWSKRQGHVLHDVQTLYGKLLHVSLVEPRGRIYLTTLEAMLRVCAKHPFQPHRAVKGTDADLQWWENLLHQDFVGCPIPSPINLHNIHAFSDASSSIRIAIIIGSKWRAWRLLPGWKTLNGQKDIGWAEAVGFELLIRHIVQLQGSQRHIKVYGDNEGVIQGWKNGRSRNKAVNSVFKRTLEFLHQLNDTYSFHPEYIESKLNPADAPSRGEYADEQSLLPIISLPVELEQYIIDATLPLSNAELRESSITESEPPVTHDNIFDTPLDQLPCQQSTRDDLYHLLERQWNNEIPLRSTTSDYAK
jgi:hypothetical protein